MGCYIFCNCLIIKKIKNTVTHARRKESNKMTTTRKLNNGNVLQDWKIEHPAISKFKYHKGFSGNLIISPVQTSVSANRKVARNPLLLLNSAVIFHYWRPFYDLKITNN